MSTINYENEEYSPEMLGKELVVSAKTLQELTEQSNVLDGNVIRNSYIDGASLRVGSGDKVFKFNEKNGIWLGDADYSNAPFRADLDGNVTANSFTSTGATIDQPTITNIQSGSEIAIQGWQFDGTFSSTDYNTVSWTAGTITLLDGTTYSINSGDTGNMSALTYIYLDTGTSETDLQTSNTAADSVGSGKILIAVAEDNSDSDSNARYQVFGGTGGQTILVDNIAANSASTNEIISNTAQIKDAIITNAKIDSLNVNKLVAGTMTSQTITLAVEDGTGDSYIAAGKSDFNNTDSGFILGIDDSDSDKAKFYIGDSSSYLNWTGSGINLVGDVKTSASTERCELDSSSNQFNFFDSDGIAVVQIGTLSDYRIFAQVASGLEAIRLQYKEATTTPQMNLMDGAGGETGTMLKIQRIDSTSSSAMVNIDANDGTGIPLLVEGHTSLANPVAEFHQVDLDRTGVVVNDRLASNANDIGLLEVVASDDSGALDSVLYLYTANDYSHIRFEGGPSPSSPTTGDFWFDGSDLKIRIGGTTYTLDKTSV